MYQGISPAYICFELGLRLVQLALPPGKGGAALSVEGPSWDCLRAHRSREPHGRCMGKRSLHGGPHCAILRVPLGSIKAPDRAVRVQATPTWWEVLGARFLGGGTYVPGSWTRCSERAFMHGHLCIVWQSHMGAKRDAPRATPRERLLGDRTPPARSFLGTHSYRHAFKHLSATRMHICI